MMKILHISNFYYDRGGDCTYLLSLMKLLEKKGHKNMIFSMNHPQNFPSDYSGYFVSYINYAEEIKRKNLFACFKVLFRTIYSLEAKKKIEDLIKMERPDIAHLQNIHHHITPSVFFSLKKYDIPIVWTLHDFTPICPNTLFLSHGRLCERCKKNRYYMAVIERCKKDSIVASTVAAIETIMHRIMNVNRLVDFFITPSKFLKNKLIEYGFDDKKVLCINNFIDSDYINDKGNEKDIGDYYVYVGRLSGEKGIRTLIDAALKTNSGTLKIIGDGSIKDDLISYVHSRNGRHRIEFLGYKNHDDVIKILKGCRFMVIPSEWYENYPYSVLEAFACGKPVIGSRIGGIPELVKENETGLTFEPGDADELSSKIDYLFNHPEKAIAWGQNAQKYAERELGSEKHYHNLSVIYNNALKCSVT